LGFNDFLKNLKNLQSECAAHCVQQKQTGPPPSTSVGITQEQLSAMLNTTGTTTTGSKNSPITVEEADDDLQRALQLSLAQQQGSSSMDIDTAGVSQVHNRLESFDSSRKKLN